MDWYLDVLKKYAVFSGRARRKEYWWFFLFNATISFVLNLIDVAAGFTDLEGGIGPLSGLYTLAVLIPAGAVSVRRLHDTDHSAWWLLAAFVPIVGPMLLLFFLVSDSQPGPNRFGPNPKEIGASDANDWPAVHPQ